jgi:long-chain acyl-CoA synthetase
VSKHVNCDDATSEPGARERVETLPLLYRAAIEGNRDKTLFNLFGDGWRRMTYGQFQVVVDAISSLLREEGLRQGDRVAIISENRPEWCAAYIATLVVGGIVVPIDAQLGHAELRLLLMDSGAPIVFSGDKTSDVVAQALAGLGGKHYRFSDPLIASHVRYDGGAALSRPASSPVHASHAEDGQEPSPDDVAAIIYTSGTTGVPKGVMLTHRNLCSDAWAVINAGIVSESDNVLSVLPMHHTYPCMCTFLVPLFVGGSITFSPGLKAADLISAIRDTRVTVVVAVPRLLDAICNGILGRIREKKALSKLLLPVLRLSGRLRRRYDVNVGRFVFGAVHRNFATLRFFASGGARLDPAVMESLEALGFTVLEGYGLTETSPVVTFNPMQTRKPGSVGKPFEGVDIRIHDDGEIAVRGPMVMKGYYKNPEATAKAIVDGWFLTGDTGYLDHDNYLFITGRKKEVIVLSSGKNIYPEEVEKAYSSIPLIKEICITGQESKGVTESLHAVIVPDLEYVEKKSVANISDALKWSIGEVSSKLPEYMRVRGYTLVREPLPRTPLGKIRRFMVRDLLAGMTGPKIPLRQEDSALSGDATGRRVAEAVRALTGEDTAVRGADDLEVDLGFDSLKKIELLSSLERTFSVDLPESLLIEVRTVGDLLSKLKELLGGREYAGEGARPRGAEWGEMLRREPSPEELRMVALKYGALERLVVIVLFGIHKAFLRLFFRVRIRGREHLPMTGPFIIAPNHTSYLDGPVVASSVTFGTFEQLYFLGLQRFFAGTVMSRLGRLGHIIPIDLDIHLVKALQISAHCLLNRKALCIFPEGGRSFDGTVLEFRKGVGVLALELNVPVIPAFLRGTAAALPRGARFIRPVKVDVVFGRPLYPADIAGEAAGGVTDRYQYFSDALRRRVIALSEDPRTGR